MEKLRERTLNKWSDLTSSKKSQVIHRLHGLIRAALVYIGLFGIMVVSVTYNPYMIKHISCLPELLVGIMFSINLGLLALSDGDQGFSKLGFLGIIIAVLISRLVIEANLSVMFTGFVQLILIGLSIAGISYLLSKETVFVIRKLALALIAQISTIVMVITITTMLY